MKKSCAFLRRKKQNNAVFIPSVRTQATVFALKQPVRRRPQPQCPVARSVVSPAREEEVMLRPHHEMLSRDTGDEFKQPFHLFRSQAQANSTQVEDYSNISSVLAPIASAAVAPHSHFPTDSITCNCPCQSASSTAPLPDQIRVGLSKEPGVYAVLPKKLADEFVLDSKQFQSDSSIITAPSIPRLNLNFRSAVDVPESIDHLRSLEVIDSPPNRRSPALDLRNYINKPYDLDVHHGILPFQSEKKDVKLTVYAGENEEIPESTEFSEPTRNRGWFKFFDMTQPQPAARKAIASTKGPKALENPNQRLLNYEFSISLKIIYYQCDGRRNVSSEATRGFIIGIWKISIIIVIF